MSPQSLPPSVCSPQLLSGSRLEDPDCNSAFTLTVVHEETTKNEASLAKQSSNFFEDFRLESRVPELPSLEQTLLNESGYDASANQSLEHTKKLISDFKEPREVLVSIEQIWSEMEMLRQKREQIDKAFRLCQHTLLSPGRASGDEKEKR